MASETKISNHKIEHDTVFMLLPWHVNGTLAAEEEQLTKRHLATCLVCRKELDQLRLQAQLIQMEDVLGTEAEQSFERLMLHIDRQTKGSGLKAIFYPIKKLFGDIIVFSKKSIPLKKLNFHNTWSVAVAAILVCVLGVLFYRSSHVTEGYVTLSNTDMSQAGESVASIQALFDEKISAAGKVSLFEKCTVMIDSGPAANGIYKLRIKPYAGDVSSSVNAGGTQERTSQALGCLRADPSVRFAEPIVISSQNAK